MSNKSIPFVTDSCKDIVKALKSFSATHAIWEVFQDWLLLSAISISNSVDWNNQDEREKQYHDTIKRYTPDEQKKLTELLGMLVHSLNEELFISGPTDILGSVFHALELHNKYHGQFFTPIHICEFMGKCVLPDGGEAGNLASKAIEEKGYFSVLEPCIGSGGMVLGLAKAMYSEKMNYCKQMLVTGCDIDIKSVHMAYLQLSLYGIPAVIIHGNSLTLEEWSRWYTPAYMLDMWPLREKTANITDISKASDESSTASKAENSQKSDNKNQKPPDLVVKKNGQISLF